MAAILNPADIALQATIPRLVSSSLPSNLTFTGNIAGIATINGTSRATEIITPTNPITPYNKDTYFTGSIIDSSRIQPNQVTIFDAYDVVNNSTAIAYSNLNVVTVNSNTINLNGITPQKVSVIATVQAQNLGDATNVRGNMGWTVQGGSFTNIVERAFSIPSGLTSCVTFIYTFTPGTSPFYATIKFGNDATQGGPWYAALTSVITLVSIR